MHLDVIRTEIDQIDEQIVHLLEKRMDLVAQVIEAKKQTGKAILDSQREQDVLEKIEANIANKDYREPILNSFQDIMTHSKIYQAQQISNKEE